MSNKKFTNLNLEKEMFSKDELLHIEQLYVRCTIGGKIYAKF